MKPYLLITAALFLSFEPTLSGATEPFDSWIFPKLDWKESDFQDRFLGRYGVNGYTEPQMDVENYTLYEGALELSDDKEAMLTYLKNGISNLEANGVETSAALHFVMGSISYESGKRDDAIQYYVEAIRKHPSFLRAYANLGFTFMEAELPDKALPVLLKAIELGANESQIHGLVGHIYFTQKLYHSAFTSFQLALVFNPENNVWRRGALRCLTYLNRTEEAIQLLDEMTAFDRQDPNHWINRAGLSLRLARTDEAIVDLQFAHSLGGSNVESHLLLGNLLFNKKLHARATDNYQKAIALTDEPEFLEKLLETALSLSSLENGHYARAVLQSLKQRAKQLGKDLEPLKVAKIEINLALTAKDYQSVLQHIDAIIQKSPNDGELQLIKAAAATELEQYTTASLAYEIAETFESTAYTALYSHARLELKRGEPEAALSKLRKAYRIDPNDTLLSYIRDIESVVGR